MIKNTIITLGLLAFTSTVQASAISFMPSAPLTLAINAGSQSLDVNNDGINDLFFNQTYTNEAYSGTSTLVGSTDPQDTRYYQGVVETTTISMSVLSGAATFYSVYSGSNYTFQPGELGGANQDIYYELTGSEEDCNYDYSSCQYYDDYITGGIMEYDITGYIGFTFDISGESHWGWLLANRSGGILKIESWGWETDVDTLIAVGSGAPVVVPVPPSLFLLVSGLIGLASLKRKKL